MNLIANIQSDTENLSPDSYWKRALSDSFINPTDLLKFCQLDDLSSRFKNNADFSLRVTKYFASLIEKGNALDPLLLQVLPATDEHLILKGFSTDAVGDYQSMPTPGLIHKYYGRVLLTLTGACPIHCRYCFRRHFPYKEARVESDANGPIIKYLQNHPEVSEVILSGGDPLMWSDQKLLTLIKNINLVSHIKRLRFHSRLLSVLPQRVSETFLSSLRHFNGHIVFVTHINHANEISEVNQKAFKLLSQQGYRLFNQSVLLRRVNDDPETLIKLSYKLFDSQIMPYYLHTLDKVQGSAHFDISNEISCDIYRELQSKLPGYLLPKMVKEIPGQASKIPVFC